MEIVPQYLFPSAVWTTLFKDCVKYNTALLERIYDLRERDPGGVANTNVRGWQSPGNLQQLEEFREFTLRTEKICQRIGESQNFLPDIAYQAQAWANINPLGPPTKFTITLIATSAESIM